MEAAFAKAQAATAEVVREQRVRFGNGPPPQPFMMALRRLRTNVALIERAMLQEDGAVDRTPAAETIEAWFAAAAAALRTGAAVALPLGHGAEQDADEAQSFGAFDFAVAALRREQRNCPGLSAGSSHP